MIKHAHLALALSIAIASSGFAFGDQPRIYNKLGDLPELQEQHWYNIQTPGEGEEQPIEVFIYGEIGYWGVTSGDFIRDLQAVDDGTKKVLVHFDTIGGDLFDGIAIHNILRSLGERCTARIDGACFSAGSVAVCGAHRVEMADNALLMIHNPWTFMAGGSEELRKMADMMDKARDGIVASYQHRPLTVDEAELIRMIDEETWLTPTEAKAFGFVDEILGEAQPLARNATMGKILNRYRNVPESARALLATVEPEPAVDDPAPADDPVPEPHSPEAATLAAQLAVDCAAAGLSACLPALIKASGLKSAETVQATLARAKEIRAVCLLAKLPDEAAGLIESGATTDEARLKLWDKVATASGKVEIDNRPPLDDQPQNTATPTPVPSDVYATRRNQASKGGKQA